MSLVPNSKILELLEEIKTNLNYQTSEFINIVEASSYLRLKKSYIYNLVYKNKIPFYKPTGKKLLFKKSELNKWIEESRIDTVEEYSEKLENIDNSDASLDK